MIHVGLIDIRKFNDDKELEKALENASTFRKEKYNSFHNEEAKLQSIAATYLIDKILEKYGLNEKNMEYGLTKTGKPYFKNYENIHFNISHSKNIAMVAFSDVEIGCDVQVVKKASEELYDLVLSEKEKENLFLIKNENERNEKFFEYWVIKEAIVKKEGTGLKDSMTDVCDDNYYLEKRNFVSDNEMYYLCINNGNKEEYKCIDIIEYN